MAEMRTLSLFVLVYVSYAKVQHDFSPNCHHFFYGQTEPTLARAADPSAVPVCQRFLWWDHFASLYSTRFRIPLYSAYTLHGCGGACFFDELVTAVRGNTTWFIEPQLSKIPGDAMALSNRETSVIRENQAVLTDYEGSTGYELGQLNPSMHHSSYSALSTFTLTNAVPFEPSFHQAWQRGQRGLRDLLGDLSGTTYFITGVVVSSNSTTISNGRVSVPSHIWTAVCYKRPDRCSSPSSFSLGLIGQNRREDAAVGERIQVMSLSELTAALQQLYGTTDGGIFYRDCPCSQRRSELMKLRLQLKLLTLG